MIGPDEVLAFWIDEVGPSGWYQGSEELDAKCREQFMPTYEAVANGARSLWLTYPTGVLAYLIVADQLPRNMFRNNAQSFALDGIALAAAKSAVEKDWDLKIDEPARQFFYLPMMHSESLRDQDRCVRLMKARLSGEGDGNLHHAMVHREIIRTYGRFPYRNEALGRVNTESETKFLRENGYATLLNELAANR